MRWLWIVAALLVGVAVGLSGLLDGVPTWALLACFIGSLLGFLAILRWWRP